ncbi:CHAT domain-containing protein [Streptomyces sp. NPDC056462]|uniref:CHAT domain-containing protein n=1 Tax=Streptomyces sp. NPDC056462 TaxID=3345826 RepID=UPI00368807AA
MPESFSFLNKQALALLQAGREEAALAAFRALSRAYPDQSVPWFNLAMLLHRRSSDEAYPAFAQFVRTAPNGHDPFVRFAIARLEEAGHPVPARQDSVGTKQEVANLVLERNGERTMVTVDNDTSLPARQVLDTLSEFTECTDWLDAYVVFEEHPELTSRFVESVLELRANATGGTEGYRARVNLNMLQRVREIGALAAFAEGDQSPLDEFRQMVRGRRVVEPVLRNLHGLPIDQVQAFLDGHAWIGQDDATYALLARRAEGASDEYRTNLSTIRVMLERHAAGKAVLGAPTGEHGPASAVIDDLFNRLQAAADEEMEAVACAGEAVLTSDDHALTGPERVEIALLTAEAHVRYGRATSCVYAFDRADRVLTEASLLDPSDVLDDWRLPLLRGNLAIAAFEETGEIDVLDDAVASLHDARARVGRFRSGEPPLMRVLANIRRLQAEATGDIRYLRESVALFEDAARIADRTDEDWLVNQTGLIAALLVLAEQGEGHALESAEDFVQDLLGRFSSEPGTGAVLWDLAGRVSSGLHDWSQDPHELDKAIERYRVALGRDDMRSDQVPHTANNLGRALTRRYLRSDSLDDLAEAMEVGDVAMRGMAPTSPGAVLARRNLCQALTAAHTRLPHDREYFSRAVELLRDNLRVVPPGPDRTLDLLNLAMLLLKGESEEDRCEAVTAFDEGAAALDPAQLPQEAIGVGEAVGDRFAQFGNWHQATEGYLFAVAGITVVTGRTASGRWQEALGTRLYDVVQKAAYSSGKCGAAEQAVLLLERQHARGMRRALHLENAELDAVAAAGRPDLAASFRSRAAELAALGPRAQDGHTFILRHVQRLLAQLEDVTRQIQAVTGFDQFGAEPDIQDVYAAAEAGPAVYWTTTEHGGMAYIVDGTRRQITTVDLPLLTEKALHEHTTRYRAALAKYQASIASLDEWDASIDTVAQWLWAAFTGPLAEALPNGGSLTVMVAGRLALLPITAAVDPDSGKPAVEIFDFRFAPSATALITATRAASRPDTSQALAVVDPRPVDAAPLRWARVEGAVLATRADRADVLEGEHAALTSVINAISEQSILHFACHGLASPHRPLDSYLLLAGDEQLTIETLVMNTRLPAVRLAVLSACDTAVVGDVVPHEVVAMPSALIQLGAAAVIAAQWPVSDTTAAVFATRFYELWRPGTQPADAFASAQRWMRTARRSEVSALLRRNAPDLDGIGDLIAELPLARAPFGSPIHWATFSYTGA